MDTFLLLLLFLFNREDEGGGDDIDEAEEEADIDSDSNDDGEGGLFAIVGFPFRSQDAGAVYSTIMVQLAVIPLAPRSLLINNKTLASCRYACLLFRYVPFIDRRRCHNDVVGSASSKYLTRRAGRAVMDRQRLKGTISKNPVT